MPKKARHEAIKDQLKAQIEAGDLPEGARLPSEHELMRLHKVSRNQARQALHDLELEGYITRSQGRRSIVAAAGTRMKTFSVFNQNTVAIALPEYCSLYVRTILNALIARLSIEGFQSVAYNLKFDEEGAVAFLEQIRASDAAGLAIWVQREHDTICRLLTAFQEAAFPVVLVDRYLRGVDTDFVVADNEALGHHFTKALLDKGHRRIGYVSSDRPVSSSDDRVAGYRRALEEAGLSYCEELRIIVPVDGDGGAPEHINAVMALRDAPTAIVGSHDAVARELIDHVQRLGYRIPEDLELASLGDEHYGQDAGIPVITAPQDAHSIGDQAAEVLIARIRDPQRPLDQRTIRTLVMQNEK
jgi:DNA-binding LacI/PurR family transcriptional regulator